MPYLNRVDAPYYMQGCIDDCMETSAPPGTPAWRVAQAVRSCVFLCTECGPDCWNYPRSYPVPYYPWWFPAQGVIARSHHHHHHKKPWWKSWSMAPAPAAAPAAAAPAPAPAPAPAGPVPLPAGGAVPVLPRPRRGGSGGPPRRARPGRRYGPPSGSRPRAGRARGGVKSLFGLGQQNLPTDTSADIASTVQANPLTFATAAALAGLAVIALYFVVKKPKRRTRNRRRRRRRSWS